MSFKLSKRSQVEGFRALEILSEVAERRAEGENIISLSPGQPCFGAPKEVLNATQKCLIDDPVQGYTAAIGTLPLRQRIAAFYEERYAEQGSLYCCH